MRNDFLPIPDAPNYEINSQLICRNRKTGRVLKLHKGRHNSVNYSLRIENNKTWQRSPKLFRRIALDAATPHTYLPIPSLNYHYEIDERGNVRNAVTKHRIRPKRDGKCVCIQHGGKGHYHSRAIADLLWEVHGRIIKRRFRPCPCSAENNHGKHFFQNMAECARFLAPKVFLGVETLRKYLGKRKSTIGEWKITYINERLDDVKWNSNSLGTIARHQAKLDAQRGLS